MLWSKTRRDRHSRLSWRNPKAVGHPHQIDERPRAHLAHDLAAVDFYCHLAHLEIASNLLGHTSADDERQNLTLARRQQIEAFLQFCNQADLPARDSIGPEPARTASSSPCSRNGLVRKSLAPDLMARTDI